MSKPERTCLACYERKPAAAFASPRARKCDACQIETERRQALRTRVCVRCEKLRPLTEYAPHGRCCAGCLDKGRPSRSRRACLHCGVVKEADAFAWGDGTRGRGVSRRRKGVCLECEALEREAKERAALQRRVTWEQDGGLVRRCSQCLEVKPLEDGFYLNNPKATGMKRWRYWCKGCDSKRSAEYKQRASAVPELRARYAEKQREWRRRNPERYKAQRKRYVDRIKADPKWHAAFLESCRIAYRLRQERYKGLHPDQIRKQRAQLPLVSEGEFGRLPAMPLVRVIDAGARSRGLNEQEICDLVGCDPRNVFAWRSGERSRVQFDVADRVLTALELSWWDVWDAQDEGVREAWEGSELRRAA